MSKTFHFNRFAKILKNYLHICKIAGQKRDKNGTFSGHIAIKAKKFNRFIQLENIGATTCLIPKGRKGNMG
jgi:hypothetical protein